MLSMKKLSFFANAQGQTFVQTLPAEPFETLRFHLLDEAEDFNKSSICCQRNTQSFSLTFKAKLLFVPYPLNLSKRNVSNCSARLKTLTIPLYAANK